MNTAHSSPVDSYSHMPTSNHEPIGLAPAVGMSGPDSSSFHYPPTTAPNGFPPQGYPPQPSGSYTPTTPFTPQASYPHVQSPYTPQQPHQPYPSNPQMQSASFPNHPQQYQQYPPTQNHYAHPSASPVTPQSGYGFQNTPQPSQPQYAYPHLPSNPNAAGPSYHRTDSMTSTGSLTYSSGMTTPAMPMGGSLNSFGHGVGEMISPASGSTSGMSEPSVRTPATDPGASIVSLNGAPVYSSMSGGLMGQGAPVMHGGVNGGAYASSHPTMPVSSPQVSTRYHSELSGMNSYPQPHYGMQPPGHERHAAPGGPPPPLQDSFTGKMIQTPEDMDAHRRMLNSQRHGPTQPMNGTPHNGVSPHPGHSPTTTMLPDSIRSRSGSATNSLTGPVMASPQAQVTPSHPFAPNSSPSAPNLYGYPMPYDQTLSQRVPQQGYLPQHPQQNPFPNSTVPAGSQAGYPHINHAQHPAAAHYPGPTPPQPAASNPYGLQSGAPSGDIPPPPSVGVSLVGPNAHHHQIPHLPNSIRSRRPDRPRLLIDGSSDSQLPSELGSADTPGSTVNGPSETSRTAVQAVGSEFSPAGHHTEGPAPAVSNGMAQGGVAQPIVGGQTVPAPVTIYESLDGLAILSDGSHSAGAASAPPVPLQSTPKGTVAPPTAPSIAGSSPLTSLTSSHGSAPPSRDGVGASAAPQPTASSPSNVGPSSSPSVNASTVGGAVGPSPVQDSPSAAGAPSGTRSMSPVVPISRTTSMTRLGPPPILPAGSPVTSTFLENRAAQHRQQLEYQQQLGHHQRAQLQQQAPHLANQHPVTSPSVATSPQTHFPPQNHHAPSYGPPQPNMAVQQPPPHPSHLMMDTTNTMAHNYYLQNGGPPGYASAAGSMAWPQQQGNHGGQNLGGQHAPSSNANISEAQTLLPGIDPYASTPSLNFGGVGGGPVQPQRAMYPQYPHQQQAPPPGMGYNHQPVPNAYPNGYPQHMPQGVPSNAPVPAPHHGPQYAVPQHYPGQPMAGPTGHPTDPPPPAYRVPRSPLETRTPLFIRPPTPVIDLPGQRPIERFHPIEEESKIGGELRYRGSQIHEAYALSTVPIENVHKFDYERGKRGAQLRAAEREAAAAAAAASPTNGRKRKAGSAVSNKNSRRTSGKRASSGRKSRVADDSDEDDDDETPGAGPSSEPVTRKSPRPRRQASAKIFSSGLAQPEEEEDEEEYFSAPLESDESDSGDDYVDGEPEPERPPRKKNRKLDPEETTHHHSDRRGSTSGPAAVEQALPPPAAVVNAPPAPDANPTPAPTSPEVTSPVLANDKARTSSGRSQRTTRAPAAKREASGTSTGRSSRRG
ncbi:hypothetical protein DL93DRAFT_2165602 [Clavulina sp. PMI_390]|nr:hypothetical protein DL93DRAFT_2165602 [Clavulina sp. PMI_390]